MVTLMQCIHDTVYTLEQPLLCNPLPFPISSIKKKKKKKNEKKNVFIGSTAKNGFQIRIVQQKIRNIKEKKALFYMSLKENITITWFVFSPDANKKISL